MPDLGPPTSYLALDEGTPVYDASGEQVGVVDHVLAVDAEDVFDGIVVDTRTGPGGHRFADAPQIGELHERGVVLKVPVADLHEPSASPAALDVDPEDLEASRLADRLRRVWDYLSGRY